MTLVISVIFTIILVLINGYFSMSELALVSARRAQLQQIIEEGSAEAGRKAQKAIELAQNSDRLLATIQVAITLVGFGASAVAAASFSEPIVTWLNGFGVGWLTVIAGPLSVVVTTLVVSYVTLILGELVPKRIALSNAENVAMRVAGPIRVFERLTAPVVTLLSVSTNAVARLFGVRGVGDRQAVSEEEIKYLVTEQESLLDEEKRMIHEIFDLGDTVAREIMTPRVDMICVEDDATVRQTIDRMRGTGFSRLPVFRDSPDRIIGIAMIKDLIAPLIDDRDHDPVTSYMREATFIPETKDILPLLGEMQTSHQQIAIVVDEYGGTAGLISIEDIVEEIVGDISDEYDPDNKYQTQLGPNEWLIDGRFPVDDAIELGLPVQEGEDYDTIAGWLLDLIDTVPQIGDVYEAGDYSFKIQSMRRNRVSMLRVVRNDSPPLSLQDGDNCAQSARSE
ncbi:MAG: hemolysin family protein [Coriobacteriales bacterium]|jgi:putative hemolysin|nr:hemolysin family protein [Coriobacteriales bacterium]